MPYRAMLRQLVQDADEDDLRSIVGGVVENLIALAEEKGNLAAIEPYLTRPVESTDVRQVFEHWVKVMQKHGNVKLTPERRRCIQARLRDGYSVDDLKQAITGCFRSDFHMARGQYRGSTRFNDLTLILRNGSKVEGFRDAGDGRDVRTGAFL